jgi:hypothetical protein
MKQYRRLLGRYRLIFLGHAILWGVIAVVAGLLSAPLIVPIVGALAAAVLLGVFLPGLCRSVFILWRSIGTIPAPMSAVSRVCLSAYYAFRYWRFGWSVAEVRSHAEALETQRIYWRDLAAETTRRFPHLEEEVKRCLNSRKKLHQLEVLRRAAEDEVAQRETILTEAVALGCREEAERLLGIGVAEAKSFVARARRLLSQAGGMEILPAVQLAVETGQLSQASALIQQTMHCQQRTQIQEALRRRIEQVPPPNRPPLWDQFKDLESTDYPGREFRKALRPLERSLEVLGV